jgi:hypothetical protein
MHHVALLPLAALLSCYCRLTRVFSCGEILSCQSVCVGAGTLAAISAQAPAPEGPSCGSQPPCTPACVERPPSEPPPLPAPRAACVHGRCALVPVV